MMDLNTIPKIIDLLEENIKENLCDIRVGKDFQIGYQKTLSMKEKLIYLTSPKFITFARLKLVLK